MPKPKFLNTFLDAPILIGARDRALLSLLKYWENGVEKLDKRTIDLYQSWTTTLAGGSVDVLDPRYYRTFLNLLNHESAAGYVVDSLRATNDVVKAIDKAVKEWGMRSGLGEWSKSIEELTTLETLYWECSLTFRKYVDEIACKRAMGQSGVASTRSGNLALVGDEYVVLIKVDGVDEGYLASYEQILMLKDMTWSRFNTLVAARLLNMSGALVEEITKYLDWFLRCVERYGNAGYELGKSIEDLSKARIILHHDPILGDSGSYDSLVEVVKRKEEKLSGGIHPLTEELDDHLRKWRSAQECVEIFGIQKLSGHPCIDPSLGGRSVREIACHRKGYSILDSQELRNNFCRLYTEGFIRKKSQWPPLEFSKQSRGSRLHNLYQSREVNLKTLDYNLSDWNGVRFLKHHDFDFYPNFTDLLDDRSISYYREELSATWDPNQPLTSHRRALLQMLKMEDLNIHEIVKTVQSGEIPFSWLVVSLYPKEREFKIEARMFAMMVIEMRTFFAAVEANWAENIFQYLPQQTMTLPKNEILEMFHQMTHEATQEDYERLYLEFDLSKWNSEWRPEVIDPINRDAGDMHGELNVFDTIHHFFAQCVMMVRVSDCRPEGVELAQDFKVDLSDHQTDLMWINHIAGVEGIGQKGWSAATYSMMDLGIRRFGFPYYLIGQGDNQIVLASIDCRTIVDRKKYLRDLSDNVVDSVAASCKRVGQKTKPEECLQSTTVITYSKDVYVGGVEYFTTLKALSRVFPRGSSDFPAIDTFLGSISSQVIAAAERIKTPLALYRIWALHASLYLTYLRFFRPPESLYLPREFRKLLTPPLVTRVLLIPSALGGLQILTFPSLLYKGGADPLSKDYAQCALLSRCSPWGSLFLGNLHAGRWMKRRPDPRQLLEDPFSLPLSTPKRPEANVERESLDRVIQNTENRALRPLMTESVKVYEDELSKTLLSTSPFNPVMCSDILGFSVVGVKKSISKMFTSTRTIQAMIQGSHDMDVCTMVLQTGSNQFCTIVSRLCHLVGISKESSSIYMEVCKLRDFWNPDQVGWVTGVTSITPFDFSLAYGEGLELLPGMKMMITSKGQQNLHYSRGTEEPYQGLPTAEKRSEHGYRIITSSAPERAIKRLADIAMQPGVSKELVSLIGSVALTRGNIDLGQTLPLLGHIYGGSIAHRYVSRMGNRGAGILGGMTFASHCKSNTDNCPPISGGEEDYPVMIQEEKVCQEGVMSHLWATGGEVHFSLLTIPKFRLEPLNEEVIQLQEGAMLPSPVTINTPIAFTNMIILKRTFGVQSSPLIGNLTLSRSAAPVIINGLRRKVARAFDTSRSAAAVADRNSGRINVHFEVLELRGCGLNHVMRAVAVEVAIRSIRGLYSKAIGELRWTPLPYIVSLSRAVSVPLGRASHHPMFEDDPWVQENMQESGLKYCAPGSSIQERIANEISRASLGLMTDPTSQAYRDPTIIYGDEDPRVAESIILDKLTMDIHASVLLREIEPSLAYHILRRHIPHSLRNKSQDTGSLEVLHEITSRLLGWAEENNIRVLSQKLMNLLLGRSIQNVDLSLPESLRISRSLKRDTKPLEDWVEDGESSCKIERINLVPLHGEACVQPLTGPVWESKTDPKEWDKLAVHRLRGRVYGGPSTAGYSYDNLGDLVRGEDIVFVGCGYGGGLAALYKHGARMIFGTDLMDDLDPMAVMNGETIPWHVGKMGMRSRFVRILFPGNMKGDLREVGFGLQVRRYVTKRVVLCVDAPLKTKDDWESALVSLREISTSMTVIFRVIESSERISRIVEFLSGEGDSLEVRCVDCIEGYREVQLVVELGMRRPMSMTIDQSTWRDTHNHTSLPDMSYSGGGVEDVYHALFGPYMDLTPGDIRESVERFDALVKASMGDLEHQFSYSQWTEVAGCSLVADILQEGNPLERILTEIKREVTEIRFGKTTVRIRMTKSLVRKLTRILPRLLERD